MHQLEKIAKVTGHFVGILSDFEPRKMGDLGSTTLYQGKSEDPSSANFQKICHFERLETGISSDKKPLELKGTPDILSAQQL